MQRTSLRRPMIHLTPGWQYVWIGLALLLAAWPAGVLGQQPPPFVSQQEFISQPPAPEPLLGEAWSGHSGQSIGALFRVGTVAGQGVGRIDTITPAEFMPYSLIGNTLLFGDLRGFRSTEDRYGANTGLGVRQYIESWDRIIGANFYYDYDNTSGQLFRQVGFGLETYGKLWDMRANAYFPVTEQTKELNLSDPFNLRFTGNNILFDQIRTFGTQLKGLDHELIVPLPGRVSERHDLRAAVGWYHFQQDTVKSTWGWKGRLEGDLLSNVHMGVEVTNDNTFDTNVVFTVAVSYGGYRQDPRELRTQYNRMTTPVRRQYNVVVQQVPVLEAANIARDTDGTPIFVEHVASNTPYNRSDLSIMQFLAPQYDPNAPLGTYENPFLTIPQAQGSNTPVADIVYVWTNSAFTDTGADINVTTEGGVRLLGEADDAPHLIAINGTFVDLPKTFAATLPGPHLKPVFLNISGPNGAPQDAVTLRSGVVQSDGSLRETEFSGFRIGDANTPGSGPTGNGIFAGNGVTGVNVNFVEVNFAQQDGILLQNVGDIDFVDTRIFNAAVNGLHVVGGNGLITFLADPNPVVSDGTEAQIENSLLVNNIAVAAPTGYAVLLEGTDAGVVDLAGIRSNRVPPFAPSSINYTGAAGAVFLNNYGGDADFGSIIMENSTDIAINILGADGTVVFRGENGNADAMDGMGIRISNPAVDAISITNLASTGTVTFANVTGLPTNTVAVDIENRAARGIIMQNNAGDINFLGGVSIVAAVNGGVGAAIEYQDSSGDVQFSNRNGQSIFLQNGLREGILIGRDDGAGETPGDVATNNSGTFIVDDDVTIDNMAGISINILRDDSTVTFRQNTADPMLITDRGDTGINIFGQRGSVAFGGVSIDNGNAADAVAVNIQGTLNYQNLGVPPTAADLQETGGSVSFGLLDITDALPLNLVGNDNLRPSGVNITDMQASVTINELNIESNAGVGLLIARTGNPYQDGDSLTNPVLPSVLDDVAVTVNGGILTGAGGGANQGRIIWAENTNLALRFEEVNSDGSSNEGIRMVNNRTETGSTFALRIDPDDDPNAGTAGTGGVIQDAILQGIYLRNTGAVSLNELTVTNNGLEGIYAENVVNLVPDSPGPPGFYVPVVVNGQTIDVGRFENVLFIDQLVITDTDVDTNGRYGLLTVDVPEVAITRGTYEDNGDGGRFSEVRLQATRGLYTIDDAELAYSFNFTDVTVTESGVGSAVLILTSARDATNPQLLDDGAAENSPDPLDLPPRLILNMLGTDTLNYTQAIITLNDNAAGAAGDSAVAVLWDGQLEANFTSYRIQQLRGNNANGIAIGQQDPDQQVDLLFQSNIILIGNNGIGPAGNAGGTTGILIGSTQGGNEIQGPANVTINDNVFFIDDSAVGTAADVTAALSMNFDNTVNLTLDGTQDDNGPIAFLLDPLSDFDDQQIEYSTGPFNNLSLQTVTSDQVFTGSAGFGNIFLMHADFSTAISGVFNNAANVFVAGNVIANEPFDGTTATFESNQTGIFFRSFNDISLNSGPGPIGNLVLLDRGNPAVVGNLNAIGGAFINQQDSVPPWFDFNSTGNVTGNLLINGTAVP